jgi:hypothetical protein
VARSTVPDVEQVEECELVETFGSLVRLLGGDELTVMEARNFARVLNAELRGRRRVAGVTTMADELLERAREVAAA